MKYCSVCSDTAPRTEATTLEESLKIDTGHSNGSSYKIKQLFNRHGYNLAILKGHVKGLRDAFDSRAVLQLVPVGVGEVRIQGLESGLYLAMSPKGRLYASQEESEDEATVFYERSNGYYLTYLSKKYAHMGWHVGITQEGQAKHGSKTWYPWGQKAIQFVARKAYDEPHPLRQIKNRHGLTLAIMNNGEVRGVPEEAPANKNAILEFIPTDPPGAYRIRGIEANLHLAMDTRGKLYGEPDRTDGSTIFAEHAHGPNFVYLFANFGWHVGLRKNGTPKPGKRTGHGQKAIQFIRKQGPYFVYLCAKFAHFGWHVGLRKNGKPKPGKRTGHGQKAIQFIRKPIVPVTPNFNKVLDLTQQEKMAFIDADDGVEEEELRRGPKQVQKIE